MNAIAPCEASDVAAIFEIINQSAVAYKDVIPADRWHEPYMPLAELQAEIARGVRFFGWRIDGQLGGVMGIQDVKEVTLIRHAYVKPEYRSQGIGRALLEFLRRQTDRPILIGTWKAATWAVRFYEQNGFARVGEEEKNRLLKIYWTVPDRQIEESVVLADAKWRGRSSAATAVDLTQAFAAITTYWDPHVAGELNGQQVKCVKLKGEFVWHKHDTEDELFLVYRGSLDMRLRGGTITIKAGQFYIVPRGIEHQPYAAGEVEVVLFEPATTLNTGNVRNELTKEQLKRI